MSGQHTTVHRLLYFGCQQLSSAGICHGRPGVLIASATAACQQLIRLQLDLQHGGRRACSTESGTAGSSSDSSRQEPSAAGVYQQQCRVAGRQWTFETGRLAKLAHGACLVSVGGTSVLATAVVDPTPQLEADGVPLQVEYRERMSAVGRLPIRSDRRERTGTEREVLVARIVDRALRPLMPPGFLYDTQLTCQVFSADGGVQPEIVAINAASAALLLARQIPYTYPIGAVKAVSNRRGRVSLNPPVPYEGRPDVQLKLTYAGSPVKATAMEATAAQVSERDFKHAMRLAAQATSTLIQAQLQLAAATGALEQQQQQQYSSGLIWPSQQLQEAVEQLMRQPLLEIFGQQQQSSSSGKFDRAQQLAQLQRQLMTDLRHMGLVADDQTAPGAAAAVGFSSKEDVMRAFDLLQGRVLREVLLQGGHRVDGRELTQVRPVSCEAGVLPRSVHGSALFNRGETQSLATATMGHDRDVSPIESLFPAPVNGGNLSAPLHLHYSFPPFSVGEVGKFTGVANRREVGHGNLARAGLLGVMPSAEEFPFTIRVTADTLGSSGSSSMAAVCAGSLALKAAGVPLEALAAGISVGLVTEHPPQLAGAAASLTSSSEQQVEQAEQGAAAAASTDDIGSLGYSGIVSRTATPQLQSAGSVSGTAEEAMSQKLATVDDADAMSSSAADEFNTISSSSSAAVENAVEGGNSSNTGLRSSYGSALLLTDIQGIEDHHGDMDFKVAGTSDGITAIQLDTKLPGVDLHLLEAALPAAAAARRVLLEQMTAALEVYETSLEPADQPEYGTVEIMKDLVPRLIGPQGETLMQIEETCGATLLVEDTGEIAVYAPTQHQYQHALAAIQEIEGRGVQAGEVYNVRVLRVVDFGAYVSLPNGLPALLHVSEISHERVREIRDVVKEGDEFEVVCKGRDAKGFVRLSRKDLLPHPETGKVAASGAGSQCSAVDDKVKKVPRVDTWQPPTKDE